MKPVTLVITVICAICALALPRKWALLPYILIACFIPSEQRVIIMSLDFTPLRIIVVCGIIRLFARNEKIKIKWNNFDKLILAWMIVGAIIYIIQWHNTSAVIYKSGVLFDCLGLYWLFRQLIRSWNDIETIISVFAIMAIISAVLIVYERVTQNNPFTILGKVYTGMHRGRYRCRGSFPHSIMLGLFWANLIPLFYAHAKSKKNIPINYLAIISVFIIVVLTGSSTPVMALMAIVCFWFFFSIRHYGKYITWGIFIALFLLHLVMKAPVWHLISRVNVFGGSTGWHRFNLIDEFVEHSSEWLILGCRGVEHWGVFAGDITNQYILEAVRGGLITMVLFITIIVMATRNTGKLSIIMPNKRYTWLSWGFCVVMLANVVSFLGVSYFGQINMQMYLIFAIIGFLTSNIELIENYNKWKSLQSHA